MAAPAGRTLFVSDLHLDEARPAIVERFERFMGEVVPNADALYILGDLFESWAGDDGLALPLAARVAARLRSTAARIPTFFMHGNRDFLIAQGFAQATGVGLLADPTVIDLYGTPTVLLHGDTLCTDDTAYQEFRAQVRDPRWQQAAMARSLEERLAMARELRAKSEGAKEGKSAEIMDVNAGAVAAAFEASGAAVMIHGHTHRPARHVHLVGGRERIRWVLPDWYEGGGYLEASPEGFRAADA
jgi:UDP-2,3-diacylglucosamine hydrolase